jgi:hypothetical protein
MKRAIIAAITCCAIAGVAIAAGTQQKQAVSPAKKNSPAGSHAGAVQKKNAAPSSSHPAIATSKTGHAATTGRTGTAYRGVVSKTGASTSKGAARTNTRRYYARQPVRRTYSAQQVTPTPDRYREIQDALAAKGYLKTPASGVWDKDSVDAMQHFQQDQKLEPTGKLTARSLGALGLGPKPASSTGTGDSAANVAATSTGDATPLQ